MATAASCLLESSLTLVGDDQVVVRAEADGLRVSPHERLKGLIEVRGLGILTVPHCAAARLSLLVDLVDPASVDRLPDPWPVDILLGISLPVLRLAPFEASLP